MERKDNYWFRAKRYGYGWQPATKEGWSITFVYIGTIFFTIFKTNMDEPDLSFFKFFFAITALFVLIAWKTGEPLQWKWGKRK